MDEPKIIFFAPRRLEEDRAQGDPARYLAVVLFTGEDRRPGAEWIGQVVAFADPRRARHRIRRPAAFSKPGYATGLLEQEPQLEAGKTVRPASRKGSGA